MEVFIHQVKDEDTLNINGKVNHYIMKILAKSEDNVILTNINWDD